MTGAAGAREAWSSCTFKAAFSAEIASIAC